MEGRGRLKEYIPHLLMTTCFLTLAVLIVLVQSLQSDVDFSPAIFTFYEHFISTFLLSILAFYCERGKRPPLTLNVFLWAFFLGFLQIPLGHLLLTQSLSYISATFQSTALNTTGAVTFHMAVILGKEALRFYTLNGQAKLWGIILSVVGASIMVLWSGPRLGPLLGFSDIGARVIGCLMVLGALFFGCAASLLVEHVATRYQADMSLSAMMCFCGALQTAIIAGLTEKSSAWKTNLYGSYKLLVILYGGIVVSGLGYYMQTWCIHKKGPVFTAAFNPLLIVFSFLLETLSFRKDAHPGSILGAIFVIAGLYLILWAKADENEEKQNTSYLLSSIYEQLS